MCHIGARSSGRVGIPTEAQPWPQGHLAYRGAGLKVTCCDLEPGEADSTSAVPGGVSTSGVKSLVGWVGSSGLNLEGWGS